MFPTLDLTVADVTLVHQGAVPAVLRPDGGVTLEPHEQVRDHGTTGIEGLLTLRGVTHHIALAVTEIACDGRSNGESTDCEARAVANIKRGAFGMASYAPWVGDDVELSFVVVARRVPETVTGR